MKLSKYSILFWVSCFAIINPAKAYSPHESVVDRLLRYVKIDTQSKEDVDSTPTTAGQFTLARMIVEELKGMGIQDARLDKHCFVYATLPATSDSLARRTAVIGLIAHMDTSPSESGANVHPVIHHNYQGGDIVLPADTTQVITVKKNPDLLKNTGSDILTSDGATLLGADDKAGCAEIMTLLQTLLEDRSIGHGTVKIAFTPDEETGSGIGKFDVKNFGARYAYTIDGGFTGEICNNTWNADQATVTVHGVSTHPGTAKGVMVNSVYAMSDFILRLPSDMRPETTEKQEGFLHPYAGALDVETSTLKILLRDFELSGLARQKKILDEIREATLKKYPEVKIDLDVKPSYRNMKLVLDSIPFVTEYAMEAAKRAGVKPDLTPSRGGTDGSDLTFMGLPCPNIFTGGENFHGKLEWIPVKGMEETVKTLVELVKIWSEKSGK